MKFNKNLYLQLVEKEKRLNQQGVDFFKDNREEFIQLLTFRALLSDAIYWRHKTQYLSIFNSFVEKKLDVECFKDQFYNLYRKDRDASLGDSLDSSESENFSKYISSIFVDSDMFSLEAEEGEQYSETWLRTVVNDVLNQIQKEYNFD